MIPLNALWLPCFATLSLLSVASAAAGNAERALRKTVTGIDVIVYPTDVQNVVTIKGSLPAGHLHSVRARGNIATAALAGMLLDKGTAARNKLAIAQQLDDAGARLGFEVGAQTLEITGKSITKDLPTVIRLLAEELRTPAFSEEEFAKARKQLEGMLRSALQDTSLRAKNAYSRAAFPPGHANHSSEIRELLSALETLSVEEVRSFHKKHYGPAGLTLIFVGDVEAATVQTAVAEAFAGWSGGMQRERFVEPRATPPPQSREIAIAIQDKASVSVLLGVPTGLHYRHEDSLALRVGTAVLGSGMTGRLMSTLRDREGLTYLIGASLVDDTLAEGSWIVSGSFAPALLEKGVAAVYREVRKWREDGITPAELAARKTNLSGSHRLALATTEGTANAILHTVRSGKPLTWLDEYPRAIQALTVEQVNEAIRRHVDLRKLILVTAGTLQAPRPASAQD